MSPQWLDRAVAMDEGDLPPHDQAQLSGPITVSAEMRARLFAFREQSGLPFQRIFRIALGRFLDSVERER